MNRFRMKSLFLFLLLFPLAGTTFLSPKQSAASKPDAMAGTILPKPGPAKFVQGVPDSSELRQYRVAGHVLDFQSGGIIVASGSHALKLEFLNARSVLPEPSEPVKDSREAPQLGKVTYHDLWDGISLVYEKTESGVVESTYYIQPGETKASNPVDQIRLRYNVPLKVDASGDLVLSFTTGEMRETQPVAWQEVEGKRVAMESEYRLLGGREVGFTVRGYNPRYPLVIDPVLRWNTFLGGLYSCDNSRGIAVDADGKVYVVGWSTESWGSPVRAFTAVADTFVAKMDVNGVLLWHTFLGGGLEDFGYGIAVDTGGNVYVTGLSYSSWSAPVRPFAGDWAEAFVAKLDGSGALQWNTFLGGLYQDVGYGIAVDTSANIYVVGVSAASWGSPVDLFSGNTDAFVAKVNSGGVLQWNSFLGGGSADEGRGIAVDTGGYVYVTGYSGATWGWPVSGNSGPFAAKVDSGGVLQWNTFLGANGAGIALDTSGNVYVTGYSGATWGSPVRPYTRNLDTSVAKLNANGILQWNTFLGGDGDDEARGICVDTSGNVYVASASTAAWGSPEWPFAGDQDGSIAKLDASGVLQWNTFLGSTGWDYCSGIAADTTGNVYVAGEGYATWGSPVRPFVGGPNAFVAKIQDIPCVVPTLTSLAPSSATVGAPGFSLVVVGSAFVDRAIVMWDGTGRPTTFISSSELNATIGANDLMVGKSVQITVRNLDYGISNALEFRIKNPVPSLTALLPSNASAGAQGSNLVVTGSAFV
ncbi:MAG: hypothetical protein E4G90_06105, partial [Gemmatimonadales bacterium]